MDELVKRLRKQAVQVQRMYGEMASQQIEWIAADEIELLRADLAARVSVDDDDMGHLFRLYSLIWTEANYDPDSEQTRKFATRLLPHIKALNEKFHFKK